MPLYHRLHSIRHMRVRTFGISLLQNPTHSVCSNAKVATANQKKKERERERTNPNAQLVPKAPMVGRKLLGSFHWCSSSGSKNQKARTPKKEKEKHNLPMHFISLQDIILLEDEWLIVAVVFVDFLVFFFDFALELAVLLRADVFGNALC